MGLGLKDFNTLAEAKAYTEAFEQEVSLTDTLILLSLTGSDATLFQSTSPRAMAFMLSIQAGVPSFDLRNSTEAGQQLQGLLSLLVQDGAVTPQFLEQGIAFCNKVVTPHENATEHDWAVAKDDQARFKAVPASAINDKWLTLTWAGEFEAHRPSVYFVQGGKKRRLTSFPLIESAGTYECFVNNNQNLFVDDVYGAIQ